MIVFIIRGLYHVLISYVHCSIERFFYSIGQRVVTDDYGQEFIMPTSYLQFRNRADRFCWEARRGEGYEFRNRIATAVGKTREILNSQVERVHGLPYAVVGFAVHASALVLESQFQLLSSKG